VRFAGWGSASSKLRLVGQRFDTNLSTSATRRRCRSSCRRVAEPRPIDLGLSVIKTVFPINGQWINVGIQSALCLS
jgi:hypothetical protein